MDYCFQTIHKLLEIMKMPEFYWIIVNRVTCVAVNCLFHMGYIGRVTDIAPLQYLLCECGSEFTAVLQ